MVASFKSEVFKRGV